MADGPASVNHRSYPAIRRKIVPSSKTPAFRCPAGIFLWHILLTMKRISSIDIARGIAMIIMPLDHTRDFLHGWSFTHNPLDLSLTTPLLFLPRGITDFCAPAFVFL